MEHRIIFKNARVIDPNSQLDEVRDIRVVNGIIESIKPAISSKTKEEEFDLKGKVVAPGFIDIHVHLREPGYEHKETIETGTLSAIHGGFTAVCCMPNTDPAIDDESIAAFVANQGRKVNEGLVDVYPIASVTKKREGTSLSPIAELVNAGAVGFSDDGAPVYDAGMMKKAFEYTKMYNVPVFQHCEIPELAHGGVMHEGTVSMELGLPGIPSIAEEVMISRDLIILEYTGGKYHICHMSTAGSVELVRKGKGKGLHVTCEVTPHHFTLSDESVRGYDTNTKMNPPLRTKADIEAIKEGLRDGTIDVIATDHAPHSLDEKEVDYLQAPFGIVGLETAIGLTITELVVPKILNLSQIIEKFSVNPRRIIGRNVFIKEGERADFTFIDPTVQWTVDTKSLRSKSKNSPFNGRVLTGRSIGIMKNSIVQWTA